MRQITQDEVLEYFSSLSNHARWGDATAYGTLNLITPAKRLRATQLVRAGRTVSCAWEFDNTSVGESVSGQLISPPQRFMLRTGEATHTKPHRQFHVVEHHGIQPHGNRITHVDALAHVTYDGKIFGGIAADTITPEGGATALDVRPAADGLLTRAILLDVPKHRGVKWIELGDMVDVDELQAILDAEGLSVEPGDALLLRTGNGRRLLEEGYGHVGTEPGPGGFHVSCAPFFHDNDIAVIGADMPNDRNVSDYPEVLRPIHALCVYVMGMWLIDNCNFEDLATACAELGTSEFALFMAAVPFRGATGFPVSPIAVL